METLKKHPAVMAWVLGLAAGILAINQFKWGKPVSPFGFQASPFWLAAWPAMLVLALVMWRAPTFLNKVGWLSSLGLAVATVAPKGSEMTYAAIAVLVFLIPVLAMRFFSREEKPAAAPAPQQQGAAPQQRQGSGFRITTDVGNGEASVQEWSTQKAGLEHLELLARLRDDPDETIKALAQQGFKVELAKDLLRRGILTAEALQAILAQQAQEQSTTGASSPERRFQYPDLNSGDAPNLLAHLLRRRK